MKNTNTSLVRVSHPEESRELTPHSPPLLTPETLCSLAITDGIRDKLRATLANQTLTNTAFLAQRMAFYQQIAPGATDEYKEIIRAYVKKSIATMWGGEW